MAKFDDRKHLFTAGYSKDIPIDLPAPLQDLSIPGKVNKGLITIPKYAFEVRFGKSYTNISQEENGGIL